MGFSESSAESTRRHFEERRLTEQRAKQLWEQNGCPTGRDVEFWLAAEKEIENNNSQWVCIGALPMKIMEL